MNDSPDTSDPNGQADVLSRPPGQFHDMPLKLRWEATRRHPYYLAFWRDALLYRQGKLGSDQEQQATRFVAFLMLGAIGVSGEPIDPATPFEELNVDQLDPAFLSGAVTPLTLRATAMMLISVLPAPELAVIGSCFLRAGSSEYSAPADDENAWAQRLNEMNWLARVPSPSLDSYPDGALYQIHVRPSQRTILAAVEQLVRKEKQKRGISERRVHTNKLLPYLVVWDLREGWADGEYHGDREHSLQQIASQLKQTVSTTASQYASAFEIVTGHKFTPQVWARLLFPIKLRAHSQKAESILSAPMRRRLSSPVRRPIPDGVVSSNAGGSIVERNTSIRDDEDLVSLVLDVQELASKGLSSTEIANRLECDVGIVDYLRNRDEDFSEL